MARIRSVKPELFLHEGLFDLESETGLPIIRCWIALLLHADREGRFEWRPRALKAQCAPYDAFDFARILEALAGGGFIIRYTADGKDCAYIPSFLKHQCPNKHEAASKLPPPPANRRCETCGTDAYACTCTHINARGEGKGKEHGKEGNEEGAPSADAGEPAPNEPDPSPSAEPDPEPAAEPEPLEKPKRAEDVPIPPELDTPEFAAAWREWIADRRARKRSLAAEFLTRKLASFVRYGPRASAAALRQSAEQGWDGVFPDRFDLATGLEKRGKRNDPDRTGPGKRYQGPAPAEPASSGGARRSGRFGAA